jgi:hypothetical protein
VKPPDLRPGPRARTAVDRSRRRLVGVAAALVAAPRVVAGVANGFPSGATDDVLATAIDDGRAAPTDLDPAQSGRSQQDESLVARLQALDPERIGAADVAGVLARFPAPRIILLQGSVPFVTMEPFAAFLAAMGYPAERMRNPADGRSTYASFVDSARLAGNVAWHYEREGMAPMLIGHSQGGMVVVKVLHELAGRFREAIPVWSPARDAPEARTTIRDPLTAAERPVVGLRIGYAAALATGSLMRVVLGQWGMIPLLRDVPDTVESFTGFAIPWDPIAGTGPEPPPYRATGSARVRNVVLPASTSHVRMPIASQLAEDPATRDWIERYSPATPVDPPAAANTENLLHAADVWWSVKRQWCLAARALARMRGASEGRADADPHRSPAVYESHPSARTESHR